MEDFDSRIGYRRNCTFGGVTVRVTDRTSPWVSFRRLTIYVTPEVGVPDRGPNFISFTHIKGVIDEMLRELEKVTFKLLTSNF